MSRTIAFTGSDEKRAVGAPAMLGSSTGCSPSLSGMRASIRLTAMRSTAMSARPPARPVAITMSGECSSMSAPRRPAAPANVTGSTAVTNVSGPAPLGVCEAHGLAGRVRSVAGEGLEAGEQDRRHRFSLRVCAGALIAQHGRRRAADRWSREPPGRSSGSSKTDRARDEALPPVARQLATQSKTPRSTHSAQQLRLRCGCRTGCAALRSTPTRAAPAASPRVGLSALSVAAMRFAIAGGVPSL